MHCIISVYMDGCQSRLFNCIYNICYCALCMIYYNNIMYCMYIIVCYWYIVYAIIVICVIVRIFWKNYNAIFNKKCINCKRIMNKLWTILCMNCKYNMYSLWMKYEQIVNKIIFILFFRTLYRSSIYRTAIYNVNTGLLKV